MDAASPPVLLAIVAASLFMGAIAQWLFRRARLGEVGTLITFGLLAGPILGLLTPGSLAPALSIVGPVALTVVLFEGGLNLGWKEVLSHGGRGTRMSLLTWLGTLAVGMLVAGPLLHLDVARSALLAFALATTSILVVIPLLSALHAPAEARVALTLETAVADLLSTVAVTSLAAILTFAAPADVAAILLAKELAIGVAMGFLGGIVWTHVLHRLPRDSHVYAITLGGLLLIYVATQWIGGSGLLAALAFGIVLGNAHHLRSIAGFRAIAGLGEAPREHQSEFIFMLKAFSFFAIGASIPRSVFTPALVEAALVTLGAFAIMRAIMVRVGLGRGVTPEQHSVRTLATFVMPRGLPTVFLAALPATLGVPGVGVFTAFALLIVLGADIYTTAGVWIYSAGLANHARGDVKRLACVAR
ncbi:MAG: cation:proton antiporter domain-containing protein [Thermoplasmatota archaeon]